MPDDDMSNPYDASDLRETLSLLGTLVAGMSDRVDGQTATLDKLTKTAAETRAAAFHAKAQMDMAPVAKALSESMDRNIGPLADQLLALQRDIAADRTKTQAAFDGPFRFTSDVLEQRRRQMAGLKPATGSLSRLSWPSSWCWPPRRLRHGSSASSAARCPAGWPAGSGSTHRGTAGCERGGNGPNETAKPDLSTGCGC